MRRQLHLGSRIDGIHDLLGRKNTAGRICDPLGKKRTHRGQEVILVGTDREIIREYQEGGGVRVAIYRVLQREFQEAAGKTFLACEFPAVWEKLGLNWKTYIARFVHQFPG